MYHYVLRLLTALEVICMYSTFVMQLCNIIIFHNSFLYFLKKSCLWAIPFVSLYLLFNVIICVIYNVHNLLGRAFLKISKGNMDCYFPLFIFFTRTRGVMNTRLCCVMIISILQYSVQTCINDHCRYARW